MVKVTQLDSLPHRDLLVACTAEHFCAESEWVLSSSHPVPPGFWPRIIWEWVLTTMVPINISRKGMRPY